MASEWMYLNEDYQVEISEIMRVIYDNSKARKIFPVLNELQSHSRQIEVFEQTDDINWSYQMKPQAVRSEFGIKPSTVDTPVISSSLSYEWDELQIMNEGKLPFSQKQMDMTKPFNVAEDRICLTGATRAVDNAVVTSVSTTGTNSVAAGTEFNTSTYALAISTFEAMVGQLIDGLSELNNPLVFAVTPDVYKVMRGTENVNTDANAVREIEARMKEIHPGSSGVISTQYLGGTPTLNANKKGFTTGSTNACLFNWNPQYYYVVASDLEPRSRPVTKVDGLYTQWVERWRPVYRKKEAIIYSGTAVIA